MYHPNILQDVNGDYPLMGQKGGQQGFGNTSVIYTTFCSGTPTATHHFIFGFDCSRIWLTAW